MKELTIEQKAKAYDEAIDVARRYKKDFRRNDWVIKCMEHIFPALKESEDERIRNEIILYIGARNDISLDTHNKWLSWLEKQGKH